MSAEHVETVRGSVPVGDLGATLMHEHVVVSSVEFVRDYPDLSWRGERAAAIDRAVGMLQGVVDRGIGALLDCTAIFHGRDVDFLKEVNDRVDIHIIASTGIYTYDYLPYYIRHRPVPPGGRDMLTDLFVRDIVEGIGGSGVHAQNIKVATDKEGVTPNIERVLRAAARASVETGAMITAHSDPASGNGRDQLRIFQEEGVDLARVVVGHSGDSDDLPYLRELMDAGAVIGSDRFGLNGAGRTGEQQRIDTIVTLCAEGYADRIVLAHDSLIVCDWMDSFDHYPDTWVPTHLSDVILPTLRARGVPETDIETMLVANPARMLPRSLVGSRA